MKKSKIAVIMVATLVVALAVPSMAFAAGPHGGFGSRIAALQGDRLGAMLCVSQREMKERCGLFIDADGDGVCDNYGTGQGNGQGYVDTDGDGVCDNYGSGQGNGGGFGYGHGAGNRGGQGMGRCA